jgi:acrylyl-CoA reductase (NADPH)
MTSFPALMLTQDDDGKTQANIQQITRKDLLGGEVLVKIDYSSLNYKDGLAVTGSGKVVRSFPMIPGIDFAGTVIDTISDSYKEGDRVVLTGWGVGEKHWGGYAGMARVKAEWLVPLPDGLSTKQAMAIGTAGFTAMLAVNALEAHGLSSSDGEVVVTGASGGAGSVAVAILAALGYTVVASTGRSDQTEYLKGLGASEVVERFEAPSRPLSSGRWAAAIDGVGGDTLAALLPEMQYRSSIAAYGLAGGGHLNTTVFPFILRGVNLLGIDSVMCPFPLRQAAWERLASELPLSRLDSLSTVEPLARVPDLSQKILAGEVRGRVVIDVNAEESSDGTS